MGALECEDCAVSAGATWRSRRARRISLGRADGSESDAHADSGGPMRIRTLKILAGLELRDSLRNRWFILYAVSFAALSLLFSAASLVGSGRYGFANFGRTA